MPIQPTRFHTVASRAGAIVENPKLFPPFSGRKNLQLLADMAGLPSSEIDRVLQVVGLADRGKDSFESYSLGMKQRLAIAAALLKNPDLLILDEPANGLDPAGIAEMRVLIRQIANEGKAVLVSSHQLAEIEQVCDQVTIIHHGHLVASGSLDQVRTHAGPDLVVVEIADRDGAIAALQAHGIAARPRPHPNEIVVDIAFDRVAQVTKTLADAGRYLTGLRTEKATLEAAFLNLTGGPPPPPGGPTDSPPPAVPPTSPPIAPPAQAPTFEGGQPS
ncbi:MAG: ATP-binding cassette domain-containing protein [Acidimicrobiales bacterium]